MIEILVDDLSGQATRDLLTLHFQGMHATSPPGTCFVLDLSGLQQPNITVWTARDGDAVLGIAALKMLHNGSAELKSMRTHPDHIRKGIARRLLDHVIAEARARGVNRLSLETGRGPAFEPALALYRLRGFKDGEAFSDYVFNGFSTYLHLDL